MEVDSLAMATRISHKYQVLLDDGNRIIIPHRNVKILHKINQNNSFQAKKYKHLPIIVTHSLFDCNLQAYNLQVMNPVFSVC